MFNAKNAIQLAKLDLEGYLVGQAAAAYAVAA
jgi:hypothetical protein